MTADLRKLLEEAEKDGKYMEVPRFSVSFQKFSSDQACSLSTMYSGTQDIPKFNWKLSWQDQNQPQFQGRIKYWHSMPTQNAPSFQLHEIKHLKDTKVIRIPELKQYCSILTEAVMQYICSNSKEVKSSTKNLSAIYLWEEKHCYL